MKITKLSAENVKRISAVEITPDGRMVVVGGKNGAGKSSVLDTIMYALGGTKSIPSQPIRNGAKKAEISLELDGERRLLVKRVMSRTGGSLVVRADETSAPLSSPQALLDKFCGKVAFDPLEFTRLKPREQIERLRELVGLDFTALDQEYQACFDGRTQVNRKVKALKAQVDASPVPDRKDEPVEVASLMAELKRRREVNKANAELHKRAADAKKAWVDKEAEVKSQRDVVASMKKQLAEQKKLLGDLESDAAGLKVAGSDASQAADDVDDLDTSRIEYQIESADEVNARVRKAQEREACIADWKAKTEESERYTKRLTEIDAEKQRAMEQAKWPVDGLGFDDDGVTFNGLPFCQASSAEALRVSVAIGAGLNPVLRVMLIRDGSLLDDASLATIAQLAEERDLQLWIERVGDGKECSVVIEDGHVREEVTVEA